MNLQPIQLKVQRGLAHMPQCRSFTLWCILLATGKKLTYVASFRLQLPVCVIISMQNFESTNFQTVTKKYFKKANTNLLTRLTIFHIFQGFPELFSKSNYILICSNLDSCSFPRPNSDRRGDCGCLFIYL